MLEEDAAAAGLAPPLGATDATVFLRTPLDGAAATVAAPVARGARETLAAGGRWTGAGLRAALGLGGSASRPCFFCRNRTRPHQTLIHTPGQVAVCLSVSTWTGSSLSICLSVHLIS